MKKLFTLACALFGLTAVANAASIDDLKVLKHSYVLVCDDWNNNGGEKIASNALFGDDYFFTPTGNDKSTGKGSTDLSVVDEYGYVTEEIVKKYGEDYGKHLNSLRLKNNQDIVVMKVTGGSKIIIFLQGNSKEGAEARIPKLWNGKDIKSKDDCKDDNALNAKPTEGHPATIAGYKFEYTAPDDMTLWVGSWNGDMFVSYIIVEANEAPGTPSVKVGEQKLEGGIWYKEVTCKPVEADGIPTVVTYTTDGSAPTATSTKYTAPIKCYQDQTITFQAFYDYDGVGNADDIIDGADNEAVVSFKFDAPTIAADGGNVTITSEYENSVNYYYTILGSNTVVADTTDFVKSDSFTLTESAVVTAYTEITNGSYGTFKTNTTSKEVYVLNPIKEKKTIKVTEGEIALDEVATNDPNNTKGNIYMVKDGKISADKMDFFVKNLEFAAVATEAGQEKYQIDGEQRYIKMNNTNITFEVAKGDSVDIKVICSKNSCKDIDADDENANDRLCYVNVSGTNYGGKDLTDETVEDANIIEFRLGDGIHTFQKYSGTGNIMIYSIEITPILGDPAGISSAVAAEQNVNAPAYNLAGQQVDASYKGVVIKNGQKLIQK